MGDRPVEDKVVAKRLPVRDAATLVIVDATASPPLILAGRRAGAHVFMAGKLVFPGGRIDPTDLKLAPRYALKDDCRVRLTSGVGARFGERRAVALALAAIRETFEETGIMIGRRAAFSSTLPVWAEFAAEDVVPDPSALVPFARAITPPQRVRRFDTRFFAVDASAIARQVPFEERPTDEFDLVRWISIDEMLGEDLAPITRQVLADLADRLARGTLFDAAEPMPCYRRHQTVFRRELI